MRIKHAIYTLLSLPFIVLIKGYQLLISPLLGQNCRFYPSCSQYAHQAIKIHGPVYGCWLSIVRISKCHPLNEGGIDNVPTAKIKFKKFMPLAKTNLKIGLTKEKPNNLY